jgi:2-keto-3-deoxy-L-rhamnonate aldolase RhmA
MEHTDMTLETVANCFRAMGSVGAPLTSPHPMVRVRENDTLAIRQVLDLGARGILVPLVEDAAGAKKAVAAAKYPPLGVRGFAYMRANRQGEDFDHYARSANEDITVVIMVESAKAVSNIDELLATDGVDGVFLGPYDLSGSLGVTGQVDHPLVKKAMTTVVAACKNAGKAAGLHVVRPTGERVKRALDDGFTFLALGMDTVFLIEGSKAAVRLARGV